MLLGLLGTVILSIGIFLSQSPFAGLYGFVKLFEFFFLGWYVARHGDIVMKFLSVAFPIGILVEGGLAIWQFLLQRSIGGLWYFLGERTFSGSTPGIANASFNGQLVLRPYGTFPHPNVLAGYMLIALVFIAINFPKKRWAKITGIIVIAIGVVALLLALSRTAIILGVVIGIIIGIKKLTKMGFVFIALLLVVCAFILLPRFVGSNAFGESIVLREQLLQAGWVMFVSHPLFGIGLNNFLVVLPQISPGISVIQPVHNIYLLVLSETGIVGFGLFIYFLFKTFKKALSFPFALISLFIFLCIGLVDHYFLTLQQGQLLTAMVFGLSWANDKK